MIKLFRKVRQSLSTSGKFGSYLLYAFGEIILVVVGILIALQINEWSEERRDRQLEKTYYCQFLEDVNQDQQLLENLIKENEGRIASNNQLIHLLQQKTADRNEVIKALREVITKIRFRFRPSTSAFEDLKSSGKLAILKDLDLKKQLLKYYADMEGYGDISDIVANATLAVFNDPGKDFAEIGFQDIYFVKGELDSTRVDINQLKAQSYPSPQVRKQLMSDAIFHLNSNARKKELYHTMGNEIQIIKKTLSAKCKQK
jgi:Family of unknown function (DUF6090)